MEKKGYVMDKVNPDLLVDSRIVFKTRNINYNSGSYPYFPFYGHGYGHFGYYGYGYYGNYQSSEEHKEGGVVVELIDTGYNWSGRDLRQMCSPQAQMINKRKSKRPLQKYLQNINMEIL